MKGFALIFRPGEPTGELHPLTKPPTLQFMQEAVGGYIELVPGFDTIAGRRCAAFCNEKGKLDLNLPMNDTATALWEGALGCSLTDKRGRLLDWLVGPVLVLYGDDEFMEAL